MKHLSEIARRAGCSISTVSRVLNNQPRISAATRKRVMDIARAMQYQGARQSRTVAIVLPEQNMFQYYSILLQEACADELQKQGFKRLIIYQNDLNLLTERYICGAIALTPFGTISQKWFKDHSQPLVCINDFSNLLDEISNVSSDEKQAVRVIFDELKKRKKSEVVLFTWSENTYCSQNRINAILKYAALNQCNVTRIPCQISNGKNLFFDTPFPENTDAVIIFGELLNLTDCLRQKIFDGKLVFAWQYPGFCHPGTPDLITFTQDLSTLASTAVNMLCEKISRRNTSPRHESIPYHIQKMEEKNIL